MRNEQPISRSAFEEVLRGYEQLEKENKQLKAVIESYGNNPAGFDWAVLDKLDELEEALEEIERLRELLKYAHNLPMNEAGDYDENVEWGVEVEQILKGE